MPHHSRSVLAALAGAPLLLGACAEPSVAPSQGAAPSPSSSAGTPSQETTEASPEKQRARDGDRGEAKRPRTSPVLATALREGLTRPSSPRQAVEQIVAAEHAITDPRTPRKVLAAAAKVQQLVYRELGSRPGWDRRVRRLLPDRLLDRVGKNVSSRREFRALHGDDLSDTLPAWRIIEPVPPKRLKGFYLEAQRRYGVDWEYLAAINLVETGMGRIRGTSVAGAQGPMQFIPSTWAIYGRGDINDPRDAIMAAARYLADRGFNEAGGIPGALFSYNNSDYYVRGVTRIAEVMQRHPRTYLGYYHWEIYYLTDRGDVVLPVGYERQEPVSVDRYLRRNPRQP